MAALLVGLAGCHHVRAARVLDVEEPLCQESPPTAAPPLRRLSRAQYVTVLADVVRRWAPLAADAVLTAGPVVDALADLREDGRVTRDASEHGGFRRFDQDVGQDQVDVTLALAQAVAAELTRSSDRLGELLGACATDSDASNDEACVRRFIAGAGRVAHRRILEAEDVDFYASVYAAQGIDAAGLADVITVMLTSPYFLYQLEHGDDLLDARAQRYRLTAEELADRLSLQFWNSIPDERLLELVDSGLLLTDQGFDQAVEYVTSSPRSASVQAEFFRELFSAEDLPEIDQLVGSPRFDAFRRDFQPDGDTREHMIDELTRLAVYYASRADGTFADLFTTRKSFATTADVATLYGVAPWSGEGEPPDMPDPERVGLLTHAAMLATGSASTRPVMKGVFIRTALLCDTLGKPPDNAMQLAADEGAKLEPVMSTRARTEAITASPACAECHVRRINPLGFLTETFDALGRVRHTEHIFDERGKLLGEVFVDTTTVPQVLLGSELVAKGPEDLALALLGSEKPQRCMAAKYYRFTFGQLEDPDKDQCLVRTLGDGLLRGRPLRAVLADLARSASFRQRVFD